jgi:type I restriction enzyme M protein
VPNPADDYPALCAHLWEAANILRGPVDAADFKTYVFPVLFFKRVSDVYDEEVEAALSASGGDNLFAGFAENHRI